ncbi:MAG: YggU family protein [Vampirovibrio sp.]|nr:YggU family protein [Vampirovibrio sp.]
MTIPIRTTPDGILLPIRVTPNSSKNEVLSFTEGDEVVRIKVTATPEGGKANAAMISLLAKTLKLPKTSVSIERGKTNRNKLLQLSISDTDCLFNDLANILNSNKSICFTRVGSE